MSQRIADSIEVLDLIYNLAKQNPNSPASFWRRESVSHVASRGVDNRTVYAHLVGKNTAFTLSSHEIDRMIGSWINENSNELENWILKSCNWRDEESRVKQFFTKNQATPIASDFNDPESIERHLITTYRVLRDTALARRIKADNDYKCQLCGNRIMLSENDPYAEAHHVKPLGAPHNGPDHPGNIVCLCPNCHVKLDYGSIKISPDKFKTVHSEFIRYHNEIIYKNKV
jgi:predicted restriction endonuclease